ncbi:ATP-binding cassette domain-containing protein [Nocardioides sp. T2.26MG-1]|uniref:ATP-binding cassette domain-containing protein n=1 Tax=Nocardioides sp. T2.26MG-1 TaxID=3041166 RepID=UPI0024774299|nr:ATP-binding cassette domain-containing protein [Nocardioides sp. T2.26MG-1]CAI9402852.1 Daunorubicin/doxorubicin resistance ATP-binding protein DrrA [Nocardioides sp. T2.26MG-1]
MPTPDLAVQVHDLHKTYPGGRGHDPVPALAGLGFAVERGTVYGLLGPNGAGKSTTVRILTTLSRADSGVARVAGLDVAVDPAAVRRRIGLVSQRPSSDPMATGRENLVLAGRLQGLTRTDATARAARLLDRFRLTDAADRLVRTWSGGMSRKLDVAIGLVHRPDVLFLDEPTTGLDPEARADMWAEIARLSVDDEMTVLLTTHYLDEADRLASRLAIVDRGRVRVEGSPEELKSELRGDTLQVELPDSDQAARACAVLAGVAGVTGPVADGAVVRARAESGARSIPALMAGLDAAGLSPVSASVSRPSLDDVYLQHVGRAHRSTERDEEVA